jgi:hypothetical protein
MASERLITLIIAALPVVSVITIIAAVLWITNIVRLRTAQRPQTKWGTVVAIITATLGLSNALVDIFLKLHGAQIILPDRAQEALTSFYGYTKDDCPRAWDLIHRARRAEVARQGVRTAADFCSTYSTTTEYRNLRIGRDTDVSNGRRYVVNFDVMDSFPASSLYSFRFRQLRDAIDKQLISEDVLLDLLQWDLSRSYDTATTPDIRPRLRTYIVDRKLEFMLSAEAIAEIARYLHLKQLPSAPIEPVWSHFTQRITLEPDRGWKIRSGLYPPVLRASYPPGAAIP